MLDTKYDIVIGDDCMAIYRDGKLVTTGTRLTFGDILEACNIPCEISEADIDEYNDPAKFPEDFTALKYASTESGGSTN